MALHAKEAEAYQLIGQIATGWSAVETLWYLIFTGLVGETPRPKVDAIFFQFETGAAQRKMIMAVADATYPPDPHNRPHPLRRRLGQLHDQTLGAAGRRNAAVHAELVEAYADHTMQERVIRVAGGSNPQKRNRLAGVEVLPELQRTVQEIEQLTSSLEDFLDTIVPKREIPSGLAEALD